MIKIARLFFLVVVLLGVSVVAAQDATEEAGAITLTPFTNDTYGITGVYPDGWTDAGRGLYARLNTATDTAILAQQTTAANLDTTVAALLPQLNLTELPDSVGTYETDAFTWMLYKMEVTARGITVAVDLALTNSGGKTYVVLLQVPPEEYDTLHKSVFLPVLDALQPAAEATPEADGPYIAEDVTFANGDITLAGTLTLPEGSGPHPAIVLISGSGPQDRDESLAPTANIKPFKLIADYLTRQGIAVLRYDDRGTGKSTGDFSSATSADFATDAASAIDYLLTRDDIDPAQIGILGHSEGGLIDAMLGASNPHVAFIVGMAPPAVNGADVLIQQNRRLILAEGGTQEQVDKKIAFLQQLFDKIQSGDIEAIPDLIHDEVIAEVAALPQSQQDAIGDVEAYAQQVTQQQAASMTSDWMEFFLTHDPADDWAKTTVPVLALFGGNDVQVDAEQNAPALEAALKKAGNTDYKIVTFPTANHLFQDAKTGAVSEYATLPAEFLPDFLPTIGDWILDHVTLPA